MEEEGEEGGETCEEEGALTPQEKIEQRRFMKAELEKKTDAPWTWVVNHFPVFSDGKIRGEAAAEASRDAAACLAREPQSAACLYGQAVALGLEARMGQLLRW